LDVAAKLMDGGIGSVAANDHIAAASFNVIHKASSYLDQVCIAIANVIQPVRSP
jgi:hypothetical protein